MNLLCKCGFHNYRIWYEDDWETNKICTRCGEEQTISYIPDFVGTASSFYFKIPPKTIQEKRRKKLSKLNNKIT